MGIADTLVTRAAAVALKENRKLILVPRETPVGAIALENMLKLARLGVVILPASPGFYGQPKRINDIVDFVVARVLDHLGVEHAIGSRWIGPESAAADLGREVEELIELGIEPSDVRSGQ